MKLSTKAAAIALTLGAVSTAAWALTPAQTVTQRQAAYKDVGKGAKAIRDELGKPAPSIAFLRTNATSLHKAARRTGQLFTRGSGPEAGVKTGALPIIWTQFGEFRTRHVNFVAAAKGVETAAKGGNIDAIKAAMGKLGPNCKACHDIYKAPN